jgi:hypothetical protein
MVAWWWLKHEKIWNFGEHIAPIILKHFNIPLEDEGDELILIIGSELCKEKMDTFIEKGFNKIHVIGLGFGHGSVFFTEKYPQVEIHHVRGKLSSLMYSCESMGDPAFILPDILPLKRKGGGGVVYAPHMQNRSPLHAENRSKLTIDEKCELLGADSWFDVMFEHSEFENKLQALIDSDFVFTNSLHCAIICIAYDVPFCISRLKDEAFSFPPKWVDVFVSFEICNDIKKGKKWHKKFRKSFVKPQIYEKLKLIFEKL